ncbi:MAG: hypothetical protein HUJ95_04320 [Bacteroidales bacterium]|nr:hypothetical protein [Bacteroidales bacterium]
MKNVLGYSRYCLECGNEIVYGREGRKFCDCFCKNKYHNRLRNIHLSSRRQTISAIETNYEILAAMLKTGVDSISLPRLEKIGFKSTYTTAVKSIRGKTLQCMCFDIEYCQSETTIFALRRSNPFFYLEGM